MESALHDYGALIAPTAAIINGFIAVLVAQFFKDHPIAKIVLVIAAGVLGAAAIGATFYSQHQIVTDRLADTQRRKEIREQLGTFISEGLALQSECGNNSKPPPTAQAEAWLARMTKFLDYLIRLGCLLRPVVARTKTITPSTV